MILVYFTCLGMYQYIGTVTQVSWVMGSRGDGRWGDGEILAN